MDRRSVLISAFGVTVVSIAVSLWPGTLLAAGGNADVEVIRAGGTVMYKYVDDSGQVVITDRPPAQYFETPEEDTLEPIQIQATRLPVDIPPPEPVPPPLYLRLILWLLPPALGLAGLYILIQPTLRRALRETPLERSLRRAQMPAFKKVVLSDGARRHAEVDCLVRTPAGLVVLGLESFSGTLSGTADQAQWRVSGGAGGRGIANPLAKVRNAVQVLRSIVSDIPVHGRVVYTGHPRFANGEPAKVQRLSAFKENLVHFTTGDVETRALDAAWRKLMTYPRADKAKVRAAGGGFRLWAQRHGRLTLGLCTLALALSSVAAALVWAT